MKLDTKGNNNILNIYKIALNRRASNKHTTSQYYDKLSFKSIAALKNTSKKKYNTNSVAR